MRQCIDMGQILDGNQLNDSSWIDRWGNLCVLKLFGFATFWVRNSGFFFDQRIQVLKIDCAKRPILIEPGNCILLPGCKPLRPRMDLLDNGHQPSSLFASFSNIDCCSF
ncbi:hypothetical protein D3C77_367620 [compost metagenome]